MAISSSLPSRYEIRPLEETHVDWVHSILAVSNVLHSPLWNPIFGKDASKLVFPFYKKAYYISPFQIRTGFSLGVF
jgi:hypothetical protein